VAESVKAKTAQIMRHLTMAATLPHGENQPEKLIGKWLALSKWQLAFGQPANLSHRRGWRRP
jgi:hypothetical protein